MTDTPAAAQQRGSAWTKGCACTGTSSGPRHVQQPIHYGRDSIVYTFEYAYLACDVCNKPWKQQP